MAAHAVMVGLGIAIARQRLDLSTTWQPVSTLSGPARGTCTGTTPAVSA